MKALTIDQPYASLIIDGIKRLETRSWPPPRGLINERLAIHASKKKALSGWTGAIVGIAKVKGAFKIREIPGHNSPFNRPIYPDLDEIRGYLPETLLHTDRYGVFMPGLWVWVLTEARPTMKPIEAEGKQRVWELTEDQKRDVFNVLGQPNNRYRST